jgi:hypothetical protein
MQFLNPLFLLGSLAVIGPILLHLIRKEESKKIPFSSLMFVTRLPKRSFRRQTLRHRFLLLLRMTALSLLALAFARPFFVSKVAAPLVTQGDKSLVILLDHSFSMQAGDRFERAKQEALKILDSMSARATTQFVLYSDTTQTLNNPQAEKPSLRSLIQGIQPSHRKTNHLLGLKLAQQLLTSAPNEQREIHWITDFQQTGWAQSAEEIAISENVKILPYDIGGEEDNVSVNQSQVSQIIEGNNQLTRVSTRVSAYGLKSPIKRRVALELNGKMLQERDLTLEGDISKPVQFDSFTVPPGLSKGQIKLDVSDRLPADNVYYFTLSSQRKVKLLLLTERGSRDAFYLAKALSASQDSSFQLETQDIGQSALDFTKYSAVLLHNVGTLPSTLAASLEEFVANGGGLITILGNRVRSNELNERLNRVLPAKLTDKLGAGTDNKERFIGEMLKQHPVFDIFQSVHHSYFMTTPFSGLFQSVPAESGQVLAKLEDGTPLLIAGNTGKGRSLLFTSSLNMEWNDLPLKSVFLPFLQQMVKYSIGFEEERHAFAAGDIIPMSILNPMLGKALSRISKTSSFKQSWKVQTPGGKLIDLGDADLLKAPFLTLEEPGVYQSRVHNFDNAVAVNIVPAESDLRKVAPEKILSSLRRVTSTTSTTASRELSRDQRQAWESKQKVWWYLLVVALLVLAVESFLSNRYYEGVSESL